MRTVLQRELRVQARRSATGWLRLACGGAVGLALLLAITAQVTVWTPAGPRQDPLNGPQVFLILVCVLAVVLQLLGPLLTADCLSEERREGTLPLLWRTPLTPHGVVLGKLLSSLLRLGSLVLAAPPMLMVPVLMGGVAVPQILATGATLATLLLLGVGCGVWASSRCEQFQRALILAYLAQGVGLWVLARTFLLGWLEPSWGNQWDDSEHWVDWMVHLFEKLTFASAAANGGGPGGFAGRPGVTGFRPVIPLQYASTALLGMTVLWFLAVIVGAGWRLRRTARQRPPTTAELERRRVWTQSRYFPGLFRRLRLRLLARNPLLWLQRRNPAQAVARWLWLGFVALIWISAVGGFQWVNDRNTDLVIVTAVLLAIGMVFAATNALREESRNGVLELLLVTGLREGQLVWSVVWSVVDTFGLAVLLHGLVATYLGSLAISDAIDPQGYAWLLGGALVASPLIALGFSLRGYPFLFTASMTLLIALVVPWVAAGVLTAWYTGSWVPVANPGVQLVALAVQLVEAAALAWRLHRELASRRFVLRRAVKPA